ncbi:MAG: CRISPR-associated endonuclease Cas2 [Candidatus Berkelbacteria bacterium]|nr:CRISPR-associated endonuclease Cas2 [Candidatus Berkelbacteria bacterium]
MLSLTDELLLLLSDEPLHFTKIRGIMEKFGYKNKKVIWSTLERLVKRGDLRKIRVKEGTQFSITGKGKNNISKDPTHLDRPDKAWDSKWVVIIFDIPEKSRKLRNEFSSQLKNLGLAHIQNSVYGSTHNISEKVKNLAKSIGVSEYIKILVVETMEIGNMKQFAEKAWNLSLINEKYRQFIQKNKNGYKESNINPEALRYWLKRARFEYLSILHQDPILPKELLPFRWMGYEAEKIWNQLEKILETY